MAITGDVIPARQRSKYQAGIGVVATLALIAGPFLGGLFSDDLSWRWIFYINLPTGIAAFLIVGARLHLPRPSGAGRVDVLGGLLATVFTGAVMLFTSWGGTEHAERAGPRRLPADRCVDGGTSPGPCRSCRGGEGRGARVLSAAPA